MPNIKPVSALENYEELLRDIVPGEPLFLTENDKIVYVIIDIYEYTKESGGEERPRSRL